MDEEPFLTRGMLLRCGYGIMRPILSSVSVPLSQRISVMSLHPHVITPVPEETARVARAAFPTGHPYLTCRDPLGTIFQDEDFVTLFPAWGHPGLLPGLAPLAWYERYSRRIEDTRLPREQAQRDAYAQTVGEDGFHLLDALDAPEAPTGLRELPIIATLRQTWQRHYERTARALASPGAAPASQVRFKASRELPPAAEGIESPYDVEARYRHKHDTQWTGYMVHISETCEPTAPHLLTHVHTTLATVHEAQCTAPIQQALVDKDVPPDEHLVDAAYISAELLVKSREDHG